MPVGAYVLNLGVVGYEEAWDLQRSLAAAVGQGAIPDTVIFLEHPPTVTLGRRTEEGEVHIPEGAGRRRRRDRPGRKVDLPRPRTARLLSAPRSRPAREGRQAVLPQPRGGAHPHARSVRDRGDADRGPDGRLARVAAAEDRLDRRPHQPLGHDARLRAQRRPRPVAVHRVDHRMRPRRRHLHFNGARARSSRVGGRGAARRPRCNSRGLRPRARRTAERRAGSLGAAAAHPARRGLTRTTALRRREKLRSFAEYW